MTVKYSEITIKPVGFNHSPALKRSTGSAKVFVIIYLQTVRILPKTIQNILFGSKLIQFLVQTDDIIGVSCTQIREVRQGY